MEEIYHHGIKGQKWGVRRTDAQLSRAGKGKTKPRAPEAHEDYQKAHFGKSMKTMSDAELRNRLNRLQMEQQYSKLSDSNVRKGKEYVDKAIKAGVTIASVTTTALTIYNNYHKIKDILTKK